MRRAVSEHLYGPKERRFARTLYIDSDGGRRLDFTLDASLTGLVLFKVFPATDERVASTLEALKSRLWCGTEVGGMARYEGDGYQAESPGEGLPGNPWITCTLWYAQCLIERASGDGEMKEALALMEWAARRALPSGVLPEQIEPRTGEPLSISPLTWSHAEFAITVQKYLSRLEKIEMCPQCGNPLFMKHKPQNREAAS